MFGFLERKAFLRPIETRRVFQRTTSVGAIGPLHDLRARLAQKVLAERQPFDCFRLSYFTANIQSWLGAGYAGRSRACLRIHKQRAGNERSSAVAANTSCRMKHLVAPRPASKFQAMSAVNEAAASPTCMIACPQAAAISGNHTDFSGFRLNPITLRSEVTMVGSAPHTHNS